MKRLRLRVSNLLKGFVLALIFSVFLQASLASAIDIESQADLEAIGVVGPLNGEYVVTQSFTVIAPITGDGSSYVNGTFTGTFDGGGYTISGLTKPLFEAIGGDVSDLNLASGTGESGVIGRGALANTLELGGTIDNVSFTGDVTGTNNVGGLVGYSSGAITNSYASGTVEGDFEVGGLVGYSVGTIDTSYATGAVDGDSTVGGLVGYSSGDITNSYASGAVEGNVDVGGLVGSSSGAIDTSYATGTVVGDLFAGGLVGSSSGTIDNSYATGVVTGIGNDVGGLVGFSIGAINNSYAIGNVYGVNSLGGLVGTVSELGTIDNSYATGDVISISDEPELISGLVGYSSFKDGGAESDAQISLESYSTGTVTINGLLQTGDMYASLAPAPNILNIVNTGFAAPNLPFAVDVSINDGLPYLISLEDSYDVADTEETPSFNLRSYCSQAAKSLDKALTSFGFKSNFSSHPNLGFQAVEQNQRNSPAVIQLFEVSEYQNCNILLNKADGLQLSISSYYKEPVEIWTQGLNGEYLYLGLVEFDKDGKAILPTLKFDTANTYQLLMIKAADKLSVKPNLEAQLGQININVF